MAQLVSVTKAKQRFLELARRTTEFGDSFIIVKDSEPVSALIPFDEYEALLETLDILESEPDILKKLKASEKEIIAGRFKSWSGKTGSKKAKKPR